ncbi:MAG: hypothetical protein K2M98_02480 [Muribaculum sp.]|nr:hypothetical protein [Muribaculum sp.]
MLCSMPVWCSVSETEDSLRRVLSEVAVPADSLHILCDMFDLAQLRSAQAADSIAIEIVDMAHRSGNRAVEIEMIRNRANIHSSNIDSLNRLLEMAAGLPLSPERDEMEALIKMLQNSYYARHATPEERRARLSSFLAEREDTMTLYGKIVATHNICVNVAKLSESKMLLEYERRLGQLISQLPENCRSLRSLYYVQAALDMLQAREYDEVLKADRALLKVVDSLQAYNHSRGRRFRNYDATRYICYTRMLSLWEHLNEAQIKEFYDSAMTMVARDQRAAMTFDCSPVPDIHMAMMKKDYAKALPLLKRALNSPIRPVNLEQLMRFAIEAADKTGDRKFMLSVMEEYVPRLEKRVSDISDAKYLELQIMQDMQDKQLGAAEQRLNHVTGDFRRLMIIAVLIAAVAIALLVMMMVYIHKYRLSQADRAVLEEEYDKNKGKIVQLEAEVAGLTDNAVAAEKLNEFKSNFIRNLSYEIETPVERIVTYSRLIVDGVDDIVKPFVEDYVSKIEHSSSMLLSTFNDMIQVYELEDDQAIMDTATVDLVKVVCTAIDVMSPLAIANGVTMDTKLPVDDIIVTTDARRYQQIVQNLLRDAIVRSSGGVVKVELEKTGGEVHLTVGGVDPIDSEVLQTDAGGKNSIAMLSVSRMLARLIGVQLYVTGPGRVKNTFVMAMKIA